MVLQIGIYFSKYFRPLGPWSALKKPSVSTESLNYGLQPGILPRDPHLLQLPEKNPCICRLSFLAELAKLEQLKLKLSGSGAGGRN